MTKLCSGLTEFGFVLLQALVEVGAELGAKRLPHLVRGHLAEGVPIHGAERQAQGAGINIVDLDMVADPFQDVVHRPVLWLGLSVRLSCGDGGTQIIRALISFPLVMHRQPPASLHRPVSKLGEERRCR